jgi:hypothetical protein
VSKTQEKIKLELKILKFCRKDFKSLAEIAEKFELNKHTLRAGYLYPLTAEGRLIRSTSYPYKSSIKYKTKNE